MNPKSQEEFLREIRAHEGIVRKVILLYADHPEDRKDLFQEILFQAWRAFGRFQGKATFSTWLYKVSLNTALTFRRKEEVRKVGRFDAEFAPEPAAPAPAYSERDLLLKALKKLPATDRILIALHLDGYPNPEIAEITGLKRNHIGVKLHRIKTQLQTIIEKLS